MRWVAFIIALAISLPSLCAVRQVATQGTGRCQAKGSDGNCRIGGAWIRRDYVDAIVSGKSPWESFCGACPISALIVSPNCDSLVVVNNFHDRDFCRVEQRADSTWDLLNFYQRDYMYSLRLMARDTLLVLVRKDDEFVFVRYPEMYSIHEMPTEFVNEHTIAGSYRELYPDSEDVSFLVSGGIEGAERYSRYVVGFDFVLDHCNYMDLFGPNRINFSSFVWSFRGDTLELKPYDGSHCEDAQKHRVAFRFVRVTQ